MVIEAFTLMASGPEAKLPQFAGQEKNFAARCSLHGK
jgi:hypothetical protein